MSDINEIKQALEKATPGPWESWGNQVLQQKEDSEGFKSVICKFTASNVSEENAQLIAKVPTWISYLISENEKKDSEIKRLSTCQDCGGTGTNELCHDPYYVVPCTCTVDWMSEVMERNGKNNELLKEIESLKAITELAVKGLELELEIATTTRNNYGVIRLESTLSEIERLQNAK